jgi:putative Ca2+/H+ antiporter (TMEM165/GDT1 family)
MTAFLTVFFSVFIAELGDKTQLATAFFAADGAQSKWLVFFASSTALVASAALATLAGSFARELISGPLLKIIAGAGYIVNRAFIHCGALKSA